MKIKTGTLCIFSLIVIGIITTHAVPAKADNVITLKYSRWSPAASTPAKVDAKWAKLVEKRSQGRIKIKCFFDGSLAKMRENYRAAQTGIADISYYVIGTNPGVTELNRVFSLPFMGAKNAYVASAAYTELLATIPELKREFRGMVAFKPRMMPPYQMHFTKRDVRIPEDMRGLKVIADTVWNIPLNKIGAVPVKLMVGDWYMSLERNLVEGHIVHYPAIFIYKTLDLLKYHTHFGKGGAVMGSDIILVNQRKWNKMSKELQQIFIDSLDYRNSKQNKGDESMIDKAIQYGIQRNHVFNNVTEEEWKLWEKALQPVHQKWIKDNADRGPSQMIYDKARELIRKYNKLM